ncbi:MAG: LacI family transcriptional regulator [Lachnospiraceae bacterium]|nr:LacI family transcriptional regulator [Lachnospiraceae bacterium]
MESKEKKITVRDVAREAGVSVATVSYILNNRPDQKISAATRKKVLQIANLLNYKPSHAAKSLAAGRNNIIGITYHLKPETPARNLEVMALANRLIPQLARHNYDVLFLQIPDTTEDASVSRNVDAILAIDLTHAEFRALADSYLVPIIGIDMVINDNLFYQVYTDYPALVQDAISGLNTKDYYVLTDRFANENYLSLLQDIVPTEKLLFYNNLDKQGAEHVKQSKVIVLGTYLALLAQSFVSPANMFVITSEETATLLPNETKTLYINAEKKANLSINLLLNALDRRFEVAHEFKVK